VRKKAARKLGRAGVNIREIKDAMKRTSLLSSLAIVAVQAWASDAPRGTLLELHSCELYAGGCVVSSEATLDGRYMLRAWNFEGGSFAGQDLRGLQVAVLQSSSENLAAESTTADQAVVYLPEKALPGQREALLSWIKTTLPDLKNAKVQQRVASLKMQATTEGCHFSAGKSIQVKTASLESCSTGACGESLWYTPRAPSGVFTVAANRASNVREPLLRLDWKDGGKRSVFLAKFGERETSGNVYVTAADLCGPSGKLF
jgi:hypothetical protein